jgi:hypothetical protein
MSDEEQRGGHARSVQRRIGDMIAAEYPDIRLDEVTRALVYSLAEAITMYGHPHDGLAIVKRALDATVQQRLNQRLNAP